MLKNYQKSNRVAVRSRELFEYCMLTITE